MKKKYRIKQLLQSLTAETLQGAAGNYIEDDIHDRFTAKIMKIVDQPNCMNHYNPYCQTCNPHKGINT